MDKEILEKLLEDLTALSDETETVEFKENNSNKDELGKKISALSNSANLYDKKNAYLIFGVKDGKYDIVGTTFLPSKKRLEMIC